MPHNTFSSMPVYSQIQEWGQALEQALSQQRKLIIVEVPASARLWVHFQNMAVHTRMHLHTHSNHHKESHSYGSQPFSLFCFTQDPDASSQTNTHKYWSDTRPRKPSSGSNEIWLSWRYLLCAHMQSESWWQACCMVLMLVCMRVVDAQRNGIWTCAGIQSSCACMHPHMYITTKLHHLLTNAEVTWGPGTTWQAQL